MVHFALFLAAASFADIPPAPPQSGLTLPEAEKCLGAPDGGEGIKPVGLSLSQIKESIDGFLPRTDFCIDGRSAPDTKLNVQVTVGCNGRVTAVEPRDVVGWDEAV